MVKPLGKNQGHYRTEVLSEIVETPIDLTFAGISYNDKYQMVQHVLADVFNSIERQTGHNFRFVGVRDGDVVISVNGNEERIPDVSVTDWSYVGYIIDQINDYVYHSPIRHE